MSDKLIQDWIRRLDSVTQEVMSNCGALQASDLNWKPNAEAWSIAQILEHIIKVNTSYYPILTALHKGTYRLSWTARIPFLPRVFGRMILNSVKPENVRKVRTFPMWNPEASTIDESIVDDFLLHQTELKNHIVSASDLLERHVVIGSPANANIVYTLEDAFHIIVTHEERHLAQLKRILASQGTR
jgi:uncharacterized damage-inducible protein DinB